MSITEEYLKPVNKVNWKLGPPGLLNFLFRYLDLLVEATEWYIEVEHW